MTAFPVRDRYRIHKGELYYEIFLLVFILLISTVLWADQAKRDVILKDIGKINTDVELARNTIGTKLSFDYYDNQRPVKFYIKKEEIFK